MSKLSIYSIGIVVADKQLDTWDIEVFPVESLPTATGDVSQTRKISGNIKNIKGDTIAVEVEKGNTITASWLSFGQYNRASAPDICRGETVLLFRYGGEDDFYWIPLFSEFDLRKQESVMYFFSNKAGVAKEDELSDLGYWFLADTINKNVQLHTSTNDGEAAGYDISIDTRGGKLTIKDTNENSIILDSVSGEYTVTSKEKVELNTTNQMNLNFKGIAISNGADELITVLEELLDALLQEKHIGNLGAPTQLDPGTMSKYQQIKQKITKFKG